MAVSAAFREYVLEQLAALEQLTSRRMFGGVGLYSAGVFFGLISEDTLFFKVDDGNRAQYERRGMKPFRPYAGRQEVSLSYFTVPADVLEDAETLVTWARQSLRVAVAGKTPAAARSRRIR